MGDVYRVDRPPGLPLRLQAAATAVMLSLLFVLIYAGTNWLTAQRPAAHIGTWFFSWELTCIPYVPLLIIPYMSCDLFFVVAPFLCRDERELGVFRRRILFSILTATALFLLMPLTLVWPARPRVPGLFGDLVEASCTAPFLMEFPHNLFPSLHITLSTLLADIYGRHTRGPLRAIVQGWLFLIGVSTILTWQHHLIDIAGGLVLAGFALYLFHEVDEPPKGSTNRRLAWAYAGAAAGLLAVAPALLPWGVFLLWPAAACGITAWAYAHGRTDLYRKTDGRIPPSAQWVLGPVLLLQHLSYWYYRCRSRAFHQVVPGVLIGRALERVEAQALVGAGVTAVVDLTAEFTEASPLRAVAYLNLPVLDLTAPTQEQLDAGVEFLAGESRAGVVYIHCKAGYSRSAALAGAYLLSSGTAATVEEAIAQLRMARPSIVVRPEIVAALERHFKLRCLEPASAGSRMDELDEAEARTGRALLKAGA
jgi:predicted protein tyrosine phosphatase/membrane-associated phospholipid phosphatase